MSEVRVAKQTPPERGGLNRWLDFETPLLGNGLFGVNPFALMRQFTQEMERTFGNGGAGVTADLWRPAIEVQEKDGKLRVSAELPGVKKEDIKVNVTADALTVEGERKHEKEEKREGYYHSERSYGKFFRSIPLPEGANTDQCSAQFNNGILEVTIPVAAAKITAKQIPIRETKAA